MGDIPRAVLSEHIQERLKDRRLRSAVFLTYQFNPAFFEQEVLPVLLDIPGSHAEAVRLLQLEDALKTLSGDVAVYYDVNGLFGENGSARLDIRRIPVRHRTGIFHAKNVFLLVDSTVSNEDQKQSLLVASLSSNLTRAGWWENVESCHVEEILEGSKTPVKNQVISFLKTLKRRANNTTKHDAVDDILAFLKTLEQGNSSRSGRLHTQFFGGTDRFVDFLDQAAGHLIRGSNLEIISPYFDNAEECRPLQELIERFSPRKIRVFLPRSPTGEGQCRAELYDSLRSMENVEWGRMVNDLLRSGRNENAVERFVHAKIYRFFKDNPKREVCFVGSANLTSPAFQSGGNFESGFLVDLVPSRKPDFWLTPNQRKPSQFAVHTEHEGAAASGGTRLSIRYHWDRAIAEGFWDAAQPSPELRLEARGVDVGIVHSLPPEQWLDLSPELSKHIAEKLTETSLFKVFGEGDEPKLLLVQEEAMWKKPSLLLTLSAADILTYWSLLTLEQRVAFIEARAPELVMLGEGTNLVTRVKFLQRENTFFDRFAGFFHAFGCLERSIRNALDENQERLASYRLFGNKYDSLGHLLDRVASSEPNFDDVDRYLIVSCARQLCRKVKDEYAIFWNQHYREAKELDARFEALADVRKKLIEISPTEMPAFLDWFDRWFSQTASRVEFQND